MIGSLSDGGRTGVARREVGLLLPTLSRLDAAPGGEFAGHPRRLERRGAGEAENVAIFCKTESVQQRT
jgi:hypothetical protein